MDVIKSQQISSRLIQKVAVHPLVLLSIVDHYNRVARDTRKRVVGVLLGTSFKGTVDVTNSYAALDFQLEAYNNRTGASRTGPSEFSPTFCQTQTPFSLSLSTRPDRAMGPREQTVLQFVTSATSVFARVHPLVIFNICDSYVRRPDQEERVIGTLLGSVLPDGTVDIRNCYAVPHNESLDQVALDIDIITICCPPTRR